MIQFIVGDVIKRVAPVVGLNGVLQVGNVYQVSECLDSLNLNGKPEFRLSGIHGLNWAQNSDNTRWLLIARPFKVGDLVLYNSPSIYDSPSGVDGTNTPFKIRKIDGGEVWLEEHPDEWKHWSTNLFIHADLWLTHNLKIGNAPINGSQTPVVKKPRLEINSRG